jgi:hypothetical protein
MFEKYIICTRGFKNFVEKGQSTGFQLDVRISYYRGIPLSCVEGFDVMVDGEQFAPGEIRYAIGGKTYSVSDAAEAVDVRWPFGDPLTLVVRKPGGLAPGIHDIQVVEKLRISYHSEAVNPSVAIARKKVTLDA